jgi:hypothetical protein
VGIVKLELMELKPKQSLIDVVSEAGDFRLINQVPN